MATPLTVKVHPVVYMSIVYSYERRSNKPGANDKALGTLLGFYEKNAIQVTNCYAIPFSEQKEDTPELDDRFNQSMLQIMKRSTPSEQPVGWFYTNADLSLHCLAYHDYYNRIISESTAKKDPPPVILLTLDTTFSLEEWRMSIRAYIRTKAGIPGSRNPHCAMFNPLRVEMDAFAGEMVALDLISAGVNDKQREIRLDGGPQRLAKCTADIISMLQKLLDYVREVLRQSESPTDSSTGRKILEVISARDLSEEKLENIFKHSLRDYMMIVYLAGLAKTQIGIQEHLLSLL